MATITNNSFAKALWPGLNKIFNTTYDMYPTQYTEFTSTVKSDKNREEYAGFSGLGLAPIKAEGAATQFDTMEQGFVRTVNNTAYSLGYIITREARKDGKYMEIATARTKALARSIRTTKETVAANMLNRAFNNSYTGLDGVEMCSTAHLTKSGRTYQNELTTAADLSEASLEQALIDIGDFTDERGLQIQCQATKLLVPNELQFEACRILESKLRVDTSNNDINAMNKKGSIPDYAVNNFLTDPDAWFIITDVTSKMGEGLIFQDRESDEFYSDNEFTTQNAQFAVYSRFAFSWIDPRGIYGSAGA